MPKKNNKTIIFDLDGTLYKLKGGSFQSSGLHNTVIKNSYSYISKQLNKSNTESQEILDFIFEKYGNSISIGLEKEFKINRFDYFNSVWDIEAKNYVEFDPKLEGFLIGLKNNFNLVLLSDAPRIWINKVLQHLNIEKIFENSIYSGEGDVRKELNNAFEELIKKLDIKESECIVIGDQEDTDILPAKQLGIKTIYISKNKSHIADHTIDNIFKLKDILKNL
jgi:HAD superfamily hydrolase (TIGR01549 family)